MKNVFSRHEIFFDKEKELALQSGKVLSEQKLDDSSNLALLLELVVDLYGVFKPKKSEKKNLRKDIPAGSYYLRERASYIVNAFLGFNLVPPTVIRKYQGNIGSIQEYVPGGKHVLLSPDFTNPAGTEFSRNVFKLWVFDYIIWASDRQGEDLAKVNALEKNSRLVAYDNGLSFNGTFMPFDTVYGLLASPEVINIAQKSNDEVTRLRLAKLLSGLIPSSEITACVNRLAYISRELLDKGAIEDQEILDGKAFNPR